MPDNARFGSQADMALQTERPPRGGLSEINFIGRHAVSAADFFFLRQPSRPNAPTPLAKNGSAAGSGVSAGKSCAPEMLRVIKVLSAKT